MIKHYFVFIILSTIFSSSCSKEKNALYEVKMDALLDLPAGLNTIETYHFKIENVRTNYALSATNNAVDTSLVTSVQAAKGLMTGNLTTLDLDIISKISIYAVSRSNPSLKREMYYLDFVPLTTNEELKMLSSTTELKEILSSEFIDLEVIINCRYLNAQTLKTKLQFGYAVF